MMKFNKKTAFIFSMLCAIVAAMMITMIGFDDSCSEMKDNILRIRILANSDSDYDQQLKLGLRDEILEESQNLFDGAGSYEEAQALVNENKQGLLGAAKSYLEKAGAQYDVKLEIKPEFFDTRNYESFTLPAGYYQTAVFTLGEGKGQNWWCVIYPEVCVGSCTERLNTAVSDDAADIAYSAKRYTVKFKTVEIFEKIKKCFNLSK